MPVIKKYELHVKHDDRATFIGLVRGLAPEEAFAPERELLSRCLASLKWLVADVEARNAATRGEEPGAVAAGMPPHRSRQLQTAVELLGELTESRELVELTELEGTR